jgi:hypothetical protein
MTNYLVEVYRLGSLWLKLETPATDSLTACNIIEQDLIDRKLVKSWQLKIKDKAGDWIDVYWTGLELQARRVVAA